MVTVARQPYWNEEVCMSDTRGDSEESIAHRQQSMLVRGTTLVLKPSIDTTRSPKQG